MKRLSSSQYLAAANGASSIVANDSRSAAITIEGTPSACAKRIKMLAVEMESMAPRSAIGKMMRECRICAIWQVYCQRLARVNKLSEF